MSLRIKAKELRRSGRFPALTRFLAAGWRQYNWLLDWLDSLWAPRRLRQECDGRTIAEQVKAVLLDNRVIRPIHNQNELTRFIEHVAAKKPNAILEIGTAHGGTLFLMSQVAAPGAVIISVDLPGGMFGGGYPNWKGRLFERLIEPRRSLHLIRGNSHDQQVLDEVRLHLSGRSIDVLFIDGDHSYAGVKQDFLNYKDLVRPGGTIAFHDILENRFDPDNQVVRFWNEIRTEYESEEIVDSYDQGVFGIGILHA